MIVTYLKLGMGWLQARENMLILIVCKDGVIQPQHIAKKNLKRYVELDNGIYRKI